MSRRVVRHLLARIDDVEMENMHLKNFVNKLIAEIEQVRKERNDG